MAGPTLVVMAAGIGSRYGGLKQMDPIGPNGELVIEYSIYDALDVGFGKVVFIIRQEIAEAFRSKVGKVVEERCETAYVVQSIQDLPENFLVPAGRQKPWGTGHAVLSCREELDSPFAVINADDFYGHSSFHIIHDHLMDAEDKGGVYDYCMVGYSVENTLTEHGHVSRGICTVSQDGFLMDIHERLRVERFGELPKYTEDGENWIEIPKGTVVSMNMWGFTSSLLLELGSRFPQFLRENRDNLQKAEYLLPTVVADLLGEKKASVRILPTDERWFGVTYRQDVLGVRQAIQDLIDRGVYPESLWQNIQ
jgi:UTP-glucose-1-phosphate uridylyltransferase